MFLPLLRFDLLLQIFSPFDPELPPSYCTVYTHLVKSGGTSLKNQLQRQSVAHGMPKPGRCSDEFRRREVVAGAFIIGLEGQLALDGLPC